jgi:SAM-dependent methyltransferase
VNKAIHSGASNPAASPDPIAGDDYYGELAGHPDRARAVGWECTAAQAARFELVRRYVRADDRVLDLGAGLGDLGRHLRARGFAGSYLGLERDPRLIARGLASAPPVELRAADFLIDPLPGADVVAAIGVLVDGASLRSDALRYGRLRRLLSVCRASASRVAVIVLLDQDRLEAHPILAEEPALGGIRRGEIAWLAPDAEVVLAGELELALVLHHG